MSIFLDFVRIDLQFKFDAGTSRGVLKEKSSWIIKLHDINQGRFGLGECGPLPGLSIESIDQIEPELTTLRRKFESMSLTAGRSIDLAAQMTDTPSVRFALETALLDLKNGGNRQIFRNSFSRGEAPIPINGLVWMGTPAFMKQQIDEKIAAGFDCIKLKIGALDFAKELELLGYLRDQYRDKALTLRVDANGAFTPEEALDKLQALSQFDIHSIEQPIQPGQEEKMASLCRQTPIPIALDEELIGLKSIAEKERLLDSIRPQYLILKPSLVGGIVSTKEWIKLADQLNIGWWMTSALESNIGLNAIAQLTAEFPIELPHGLGTGQLYHNNIDSPLDISEGQLKYDPHKSWIYSDLSLIN